MKIKEYTITLAFNLISTATAAMDTDCADAMESGRTYNEKTDESVQHALCPELHDETSDTLTSTTLKPVFMRITELPTLLVFLKKQAAQREATPLHQGTKKTARQQ